jgi:4-diphosphocytidyl-2-C-methyl-D-erythritol kinase
VGSKHVVPIARERICTMSPVPPKDNPARADAPAKLNLYLHIVGRRADGYHLLESLVAFTGTGDRVSAKAGKGLSLAVEGPFAASLRQTPDEDNLVLKAARGLEAWARAQGRPVEGAALQLHKVLPVASGIGGGSADAAAALLALIRLWSLPIAGEALGRLAESLGADVPACVRGQAVLMEGIGERLSVVPALPDVPVLLVNPGVALPTPAVYRAFREGFALKPLPRPKPVGPWREAAALARSLEETVNDLEAPAIALCPPIAAALRALRAEGALLARMSGSGATTFALFADAVRARAAASRIRAAEPGWWVMQTALRSAA